MANYYASTRSNYFRVKDRDAFADFCARFFLLQYDGADETVMITADSGDCGGWPSYDMETDDEVDFPRALSAHLVDGEVAVLMEAGHEKLRYLHGQSVAVNSAGDMRWVTLSDIYELAKELTDKPITDASY